MSVTKWFFLMLTLAATASVSAQTCSTTIVKTTPTAAFSLYSNGAVTHTKTGLMWRRCLLGQAWDGSNCTGNAIGYTWSQALLAVDAYAGYSDWRVPNKNELASLVERACLYPAINTTVFPNDPSSIVWSSSPANRSDYAWYVNFSNGYVNNFNKASDGFHVRLVRGGQ